MKQAIFLISRKDGITKLDYQKPYLGKELSVEEIEKGKELAKQNINGVFKNGDIEMLQIIIDIN